MKKTLLLLTLAVLILSACTTPRNSLVGTWKLTAYGPKATPTPAVTDAEATLTFDKDGNVFGSGGCNSLGGTYKVDGNEITFSEITSTLMACEDERMTQEGVVTLVLSGTATYEIKDNMLTLTREDMVLIFTSTSAPGSYPNSYSYP